MFMSNKAKVFIALPHQGWVIPETLMAIAQPSCIHDYKIVRHRCTWATANYNTLWCNALNSREDEGWTHFAMLHTDVAPSQFWLDILIHELGRLNADVMSAVIPIKGDEGSTSTAVMGSNGPWNIRRLTMTDVFNLPETFCNRDVDPTKTLLVNNGCWVCRFDQPWVEEVCFSATDALVRNKDGTFSSRCFSEDWRFSNWCHEQGLKVYATRKVKIGHVGHMYYTNDCVWGDWDTDVEAA